MPPMYRNHCAALIGCLAIAGAQAQMPETGSTPQQTTPEQQTSPEQQAPQQQAPQQQSPEQQAPQQQPQQQPDADQQPQQPPQQQQPQQEPEQEPPQQPQQEPQQQEPTGDIQAGETPTDQQGEENIEEEGGLALTAYGNADDTAEIQLGFGGRLDRGLGYLYLGHFETVSRASVRSGGDATIPENRYRSTRLGLYAEGHDSSNGEGFGFGAFLYHNRSELEIDRYGLGTTLDLAYVAADRVRLSAGVDLMPQFASTDWDADAMLEYEWHADLRVLVHPVVDVGINWRVGRTNDRSLSTTQYEELTAGFRLVF